MRSRVGARSMCLVLVAAVTNGCDGAKEATPQSQADIATAADEGRTPVASVNGVFIYDDCVVAELEAEAADHKQAVQTCIDFELAAQAAGHHAGDDDVARAGMRASVRVLIERSFLSTSGAPEHIPDKRIRELWKERAVQFQFNRPEYRHYSHALVRVEPKLADHAPEVRRAFARMNAFKAELGKRSFSHAEFAEFFAKHGDTADVGIEAGSTPKRGRTVPKFADALFSINAPGHLAKPIRTRYGVHLIRLGRVDPPRTHTYAEAAPKIRERAFLAWQKTAFLRWMGERLKKNSPSLIANALPVPLNVPPPPRAPKLKGER